MKPEELQIGTYRLVRAVQNPEHDLRHRHDWTQFKEWPEGKIFTVEQYLAHDRETKPRLVLRSRGDYRELHPHDARYALLADSLERVEEKPSDFLHRYATNPGYYAVRMLNYLAKIGRLTTSEVESFVKSNDAEDGS